MGKYFKEDNNKRVSQVKADVDVESLAKRLIMAQGSVVRFFGVGAPKKVITPGKKPYPGMLGYGLSNDRVELDPGKPAQVYTKTLRKSLLGKIIDALLPAKVKFIKDFLLELDAGGLIDKALSKGKITDTLNKPYTLKLNGKTQTREVKLRDIINKFNPSEATLEGVVYDFTPKQIDEIYDDCMFLTKQADKWARIKAGGTAAAAGALATGVNVDQGKDRSRPEVQKIAPTIQKITQPQTYDDSADPIAARKNK